MAHYPIFTYFYYRPKDGLTKIGRSTMPKQRYHNLGGMNQLVRKSILSGDREEEMHGRFSDYRVKGEWFNLPLEMIPPTEHQDWPPECGNCLKITVPVSVELMDEMRIARQQTGYGDSMATIGRASFINFIRGKSKGRAVALRSARRKTK